MKDRLETNTPSEKGQEAQNSAGELLLRATELAPGTSAEKRETESLSKKEVENGNLPNLELIPESNSAEASANPRGAEAPADPQGTRDEGLATDGEAPSKINPAPSKINPSGEGNDGIRKSKVEEQREVF